MPLSLEFSILGALAHAISAAVFRGLAVSAGDVILRSAPRSQSKCNAQRHLGPIWQVFRRAYSFTPQVFGGVLIKHMNATVGVLNTHMIATTSALSLFLEANR